ncbi:hypothetical protein FHG87_024257 [Trinorchestia longiramus]|nr:hypothetical protein FHG87_024257 [Trinorchestia longiramus]
MSWIEKEVDRSRDWLSLSSSISATASRWCVGADEGCGSGITPPRTSAPRTTPGTTAPGATAPGTAPGETAPGATAPGATAPGATAPGATAPDSSSSPDSCIVCREKYCSMIMIVIDWVDCRIIYGAPDSSKVTITLAT